MIKPVSQERRKAGGDFRPRGMSKGERPKASPGRHYKRGDHPLAVRSRVKNGNGSGTLLRTGEFSGIGTRRHSRHRGDEEASKIANEVRKEHTSRLLNIEEVAFIGWEKGERRDLDRDKVVGSSSNDRVKSS